ncbi:MAG: response regulator [Rhodospirillales bacterium]|nr:response regulator [Rhodospirillales bacterium]
MLRLLSYAGFALIAFLMITLLFITQASFSDEIVGKVTFSLIAMVEIIALITILVGWMIYELTGRAQYMWVVVMMGFLLLGDVLGVPRLFWVDETLGEEQALGTFTGLLILVTRVLASLAFVLSWHYANKDDQIFVREQVVIATLIVFVVAWLSMVALTWFLSNMTFGFKKAFQDIATLILMPGLVMAFVGTAGYLVRCFVRRSVAEGMLCVTMMFGVFNHLALFYLADDGAGLAARFVIPSRMLSYSLVLCFILLSMRNHFRHSFQASSAKSEFLATMSHEIRTPLNGVLGLAQLLRESELTQTQLGRVNGILSSGRTLMTLLNDILDMSKIEAGRVELENRQFYPSDITYDLRKFVGSVADEKNLAIVYDDDVLDDLMFTGDEIRLRQILWNLMSNAVKFTHKGSVRLEVKKVDERPPFLEEIRALRDGETLFHFAVIDTGIGIAKERQRLIFAPFTQADNSTTREYGGTGLGLSIAFSLTELMGGKMTVSSVERQGSRFDVWLPFKSEVAEVRRVGKTEETVEAGDGGLAGARILVVEDNEINAIVVSEMLKRHDINVTAVSNGREAVHTFRDGDFDLILMDAHMPVLDGEGATRLIREHERLRGNRRVPIICLTADAFSDRHRDFLTAGMDEVLTKPIEERKLYSTLVRFLRDRPRALPAHDDDALLASADKNNEGSQPIEVTPKSGKAFVDQQQDMNHESEDREDTVLTKTVLVEEAANKLDTDYSSATKEMQMDLIDKGRFDEVCAALGKEQLAMLVGLLPASYQEERGRLIEAASNNDGNALRVAAHTIKGMAGNMAGQGLANAARALETYEGDFGDDLSAQIKELDKLAEETVTAMQDALR